jgi:hypothetical protein
MSASVAEIVKSMSLAAKAEIRPLDADGIL